MFVAGEASVGEGGGGRGASVGAEGEEVGGGAGDGGAAGVGEQAGAAEVVG